MGRFAETLSGIEISKNILSVDGGIRNDRSGEHFPACDSKRPDVGSFAEITVIIEL